MYKIILPIICLLFFSSIGQAKHIKSSKVPDAVKIAFKSIYPSVTKNSWEMENGQYEAEFDLNGVENSVVFDANGNITETEREIPVSQLPEKVSQYVKTNFAGRKIKEASVIMFADTKKYEVQIGRKDYLFNENGELLSK